MLKAFKYRIYPTKEQSVLIDKHIGACRFIYNLSLETKQIAYAGYKINLSCFDLVKQLPDLKKECIWLKEINSQSLQQSIINLDIAFTSFFKGQKDFPKYKKKYSKQAFNIPQNIIIKEDKLIIPKFKKGIKIILDRETKGNIRQTTITKSSTGKYFASVLCETGEKIKSKTKITNENSIGIDLSIKSFLVTSNGDEINNPKFYKKSLSKLKYLQSKFSKYKGKKTKQKLAILHEKIANQRKDFLQKTSSKIIRENQTICLEDLNIKDMLQNNSLSQSINDVGWGMFVGMLKYKAEWYGNNIIQIGRFDPSSKTCSCCGNINKELKLSDREWICSKCNIKHNRDVNAAINIKTFALRNHLSMDYRLKNHKELPTLVGALTYEITI